MRSPLLDELPADAAAAVVRLLGDTYRLAAVEARGALSATAHRWGGRRRRTRPAARLPRGRGSRRLPHPARRQRPRDGRTVHRTAASVFTLNAPTGPDAYESKPTMTRPSTSGWLYCFLVCRTKSS